MGDRPEDSRGGSSSEERSSGLPSLTWSCLCDRGKAGTLSRCRAARERAACSEASGCLGIPAGLPMGRRVWPHHEGKVFQSVISALPGTHEASPSSRLLAAKTVLIPVDLLLSHPEKKKEKKKEKGGKRGLLFVKLHFPAMRVSHTFRASSFVFG